MENNFENIRQEQETEEDGKGDITFSVATDLGK